MSNEEMNKKMEFIVEQQAQFAADIQVMREVQAQDAKLLKEQDRKLSDAVVTVVGLIGSLTQAQTSTDGRINVLADSFNRLAQAQARTEESLKILINVVERHISGNGGSTNPS
jgi:hypothetical protein